MIWDYLVTQQDVNNQSSRNLKNNTLHTEPLWTTLIDEV